MVETDQAVLGYQGGHRLLGSSRELGSEAVGALIAATDAPVRVGRVLTGFPLPGDDLYALCATWPDPGSPRAGAVWAHAILLDDSAFEMSPNRWVAALKKPSSDTLARYGDAVSPVPAGSGRPAVTAVHSCVAAAYATRRRVAFVNDPVEAEAALLAVWAGQWPELRKRFAFRIRDSGPASGQQPPDLTVVLGEATRPTSVGRADPDQEWTLVLAEELAGTSDSVQNWGLTPWLGRFGPEESPRPASLRALARLWSDARTGTATSLVERIQARYPVKDTGSDLKQVLLELNSPWRQSGELDLLRALLASSEDAWDADRLNLSARLAVAAGNGEVEPLLESLASPPVPEMRQALLMGLAATGSPAVVASAAKLGGTRFAAELMVEGETAVSPEAWRELPPGRAQNLIKALLSLAPDLGSAEVARAALEGGQLAAVLAVCDLDTVAEATSKLDDRALKKLVGDPDVDGLVAAADPHDVLRMAEAGMAVDPTEVLETLDHLRDDPDSVWLAAAISALGRDRDALEVVFSPLHAALIGKRVSELQQKRLRSVMPKGPDLPRSLRSLLVHEARAGKWNQRRLSKALRGSGSTGKQILKDVDDDDPVAKLIKRGLKRLGIKL